MHSLIVYYHFAASFVAWIIDFEHTSDSGYDGDITKIVIITAY